MINKILQSIIYFTMTYKGIKNYNADSKIQQGIKRKNLNYVGLLFVCIITFSCVNFSLFNLFNLGSFVKRVTLYWSPKPEDMGKIKFVNFSFNNLKEKDDGVFIVSSPFKNYYVTNITDTVLNVNGLGDPIVISPINGKVQNVKASKNGFVINIVSGNVVVNLIGLSNACINVGSQVKVGDKIGVSNNSQIQFSIICDGQYIELPASGAEGKFFE